VRSLRTASHETLASDAPSPATNKDPISLTFLKPLLLYSVLTWCQFSYSTLKFSPSSLWV